MRRCATSRPPPTAVGVGRDVAYAPPIWEERVNDLRGGKQVIEWSDLDNKRTPGDREVVTDEKAKEILLSFPANARQTYFDNMGRAFSGQRHDASQAKYLEDTLGLPIKNAELGSPCTDDEVRKAQVAAIYYSEWSKAQLEALDRLEGQLAQAA